MEELDEKRKKKYKIIRVVIQSILLLVIVGAIIAATAYIYPLAIKVQDDEVYRNEIISNIRAFGGWSFLIVVGAEILQTVLAIIPSGPIVMISGLLFHPIVAVLVCLIGQTIGCMIVYGLVKLLGVRFLAVFVNPDKIRNSKLLSNDTRCEVIMFGYLLIPALPKDIVAFIAPFTKVSFKNFTLISFFARIPMTIVTVLMGTSIISGSYTLAIILAVLSGMMALLCFIFNGKIVRFLEKKQKEKNINK